MLGRRGRLVVATADCIFATVVVKYGQLLMLGQVLYFNDYS